MIKMMMTAAFAVTTLAAPAIAQTTGSGSMGSGSSTGGMQSGSMGSDGAMAPHMTRAQMATMHRCQAMSHDRMMKNKTCMRFHAAHPDMMAPSGM